MKTFTLKEMVEHCPKCFLCQKDYLFYLHFHINYDVDQKFFKGLGTRVSKLSIKDGKLGNKEHWKFDIETGAVESNITLFNQILSGYSKPRLVKKCKSCDVSIFYEPMYDFIHTYKVFPEVQVGTHQAKFDITPRLRVVINQHELGSKLSIYDAAYTDAICRQMINPIDFSGTQTFKNLKNKIKMILAFM